MEMAMGMEIRSSWKINPKVAFFFLGHLILCFLIENLSFEDDLKICGEVISKIMIISQNQQFLQFIFEEPLQSQMLYNAILRFYEKFVKVNK